MRRLIIFSFLLVACAPPPDLGGQTGDGTDPSGDAGSVGGSETGSEGGGTGLDESRLDRSAGNLDGDGCGYPGPGEDGYGTDVGQRLANFTLIDCEGNSVEFADYFCKRDDAFGDYNSAVLVNIGAGWCGPCIEETRDELPQVYAERHDQGVEFVQVMFQDWEAQLPTKSFCSDWESGQWEIGGEQVDLGFELGFPVLLDQTNDWTSIYLQDPQAATPVNMLLDANGNIRWKLEGQKPTNLDTQIDLVMAQPYEVPG